MILFEGASATVEELMAHCEKTVMERAAMPKYLEILPEVPKTAVGKVFKPDLRKMAIERIYNEALEAAGVAVESQYAYYDEFGNRMQMVTGDVEGVTNALSGAAVVGYDFVGSLEQAASRGDNLRVNLEGDFDAIKAALEAAKATGVGTFTQLEQTGTGAIATLHGDMMEWDAILQGVVNQSIADAANTLVLYSSGLQKLIHGAQWKNFIALYQKRIAVAAKIWFQR